MFLDDAERKSDSWGLGPSVVPAASSDSTLVLADTLAQGDQCSTWIQYQVFSPFRWFAISLFPSKDSVTPANWASEGASTSLRVSGFRSLYLVRQPSYGGSEALQLASWVHTVKAACKGLQL